MRLDSYLVEKEYFDSRTKAKQAIERGEVFLDSIKITKPSYFIDENIDYIVKILCEESYVSLGGYKLKKALNDFNYSVENLTVCDMGASTGGFTDCLIKNGAKKVYAVDLNDQLLHEKLKKDPKVKSIIKNVREINKDDFNDKIDLIVADLSFISLKYVLYSFSNLIDDGAKIITLIKPQFEVGEKLRFKNGIIRDKKIRKNVCESIFNYALENNLTPIGFTTAPIMQDKNVEYLLFLEKNGKNCLDFNNLTF